MGRKYLEHPGGTVVYHCAAVRCGAPLANHNCIISSRFTGSTGKAFLFSTAVNIICSTESHEREMLTGKHFVRDVLCKKCGTKLGWYYEYAAEGRQRYKEGKVVLERALIQDKRQWIRSLSDDNIEPQLNLHLGNTDAN